MTGAAIRIAHEDHGPDAPSSGAVRPPSRASSLPRPLSRCQVWLAGDTLRDIFVLQVHRRD
ncbi:hypothetical protein EGV01_28795 [Pseudomonas syringae pv. theae]|nr:hypothetical protein [Pseudomonas syringae pv. theae]